ncbi:hypothetical protein NUW54_g7472 [Trametes sanguinea]|uniref:Uncharacterized protein n=1 Tax=Trametes sanguinea TaxID=158606 RepID=A0ACC1PN12_9APHY|nr:hypothetical protein NUW54_g7472 [Trametes sanguinea]
MKLGFGTWVSAALGASAVLGVAAQCPDFTTYSQSPQGNPSSGPLALPYMRPAPACRTFNSTSVEKVISDMKTRLKDPDLARLFENTFPNTLDTTVKYFNATENLAFIITGDITAQWLRDTANQFAHYHTLLSSDRELATLVKAVINNEARYVSQYPYCGAFQPPPESGLAPSHNDWADGVTVNPPVNNQTVFECKYEIDSLCGFLKLSRSYYQATKDSSFMNSNWFAAVDQIFRVIWEQSQSTFDDDYNLVSYYNWTGGNGALSPAVNNAGNGEPKLYTGLVGTHHRPSDDLSTFGTISAWDGFSSTEVIVAAAFLVPANAMLSVELTNLANMLDATKQAKNISQLAKKYSSTITNAIWETTLVDNIFAYETNGKHIWPCQSLYLTAFQASADAMSWMMPTFRYEASHLCLASPTEIERLAQSLLSLPYLGFLKMNHPAYVATRKLLLSRKNPYYAAGKNFSGIGGPHVDAWNPWPMSQISAIFGTDDDKEIMQSLYLIANNTGGLGLIHESISIYDGTYTRPWFAWANSYFAEMLLDLAQRKPHLIFKENKPYTPGQ